MTTLTSLTRGSATATTGPTTASITTTANRLALLAVASREQFNFVASAIPTCTGWTQIDTREYDQDGSSRERITLFRLMGGSNATGTHTISFGSTSQAVVRWSIVETDSDVDTGGTNGSAAIVQSVQNGGASTTSLTVTLAAFASASNATYGCFAFGGNGSSGTIDLTEGSGFTALDDISGTGILDAGLLVEYNAANDTGVDCTNAITSLWCGGIAVEIAAGAAGSTYELAADGGTYSLTGTDAALTVARTIAADTGSYSLSGTDVSLQAGRTIVADGGTYSLSGTDAALTVGRVLVADGGTYSLTGQDADLVYTPAGATYDLVAEGGTFAFSGADVAFSVSRVLSAESGAYSYSGQDVTLSYSAEPEPEPQTQTTGVPGGRPWIAYINGKRVSGSLYELRRLIEELAEEQAEEAVETGKEVKKPRIVVQPGKAIAKMPELTQEQGKAIQAEIRSSYNEAYIKAKIKYVEHEAEEEATMMVLLS